MRLGYALWFCALAIGALALGAVGWWGREVWYPLVVLITPAAASAFAALVALAGVIAPGPVHRWLNTAPSEGSSVT